MPRDDAGGSTVGDAAGSQPDILREQSDYYRSLGAEYEGRFLDRMLADRAMDLDDKAVAAVVSERDEVLAAFDALDLGSSVLELAPGTGIWTRRIAARGSVQSVRAVDASIEMVTANLSSLGGLGDKVRFTVSDLFEWQPDASYDSVVFAYWISHVPQAHLEVFVKKLAASLRLGGTLFFVDDKRPEGGASSERSPRKTEDGRTFHVVKNYWEPGDLQQSFSAAGLDVEVRETASFFQYGTGTRTA